jgi:hypothetical protein
VIRASIRQGQDSGWLTGGISPAGSSAGSSESWEAVGLLRRSNFLASFSCCFSLRCCSFCRFLNDCGPRPAIGPPPDAPPPARFRNAGSVAARRHQWSVHSIASARQDLNSISECCRASECSSASVSHHLIDDESGSNLPEPLRLTCSAPVVTIEHPACARSSRLASSTGGW